MNKWWFAFLVLVFLYVIGSLTASFILDEGNSFGDKIVVVPLSGVITTGNSLDFFRSNIISSTRIVKDIEALGKDSSVMGIIFEIDSPGGTAVASQEIADAIKKLNKPSYAVIRDVGASGAYWIASAADKIIASPISVTGSIGVMASYLQFSELFDKYGVTYERLVAGEMKDIGSPYRELTDNEMKLLKAKLNIMHDFFIEEVARNRNLSVSHVKNISTGEFFLGKEALELGLVDVLGNRDTAVELMKKELNVTDLNVVEKQYEKGLVDILIGKSSYAFGRGFARELVEIDTESRFEIKV